MFPSSRARTTPSPGRDLVATFCLTIVLPGIILAAFGVHALRQDQQVAEARARDDASQAATAAAKEVASELARWTAALELIGSSRPPDARALPALLRPAIDEPGIMALVWNGTPAPRVWPEHQMLYSLAPDVLASDSRGRGGTFALAERAELGDKDFTRAAMLYEQSLTEAHPHDRPLVRQRIARTQGKAGRLDRAREAYRALLAGGGQVGSVPAEVIARHGLCALDLAAPDRGAPCGLDLYRDLADGRWTIDKPRYLFYAAEARRLAEREGATADMLAPIDARSRAKETLTEAVETAVNGGSVGTDFLVIGRPDSAAQGATSPFLVIRASWLAAGVWQALFTQAHAAGFIVRLSASNGSVLFTPAGSLTAGATAEWSESRPVADDRLRLRVDVRPRQLELATADARARQLLYRSALGIVVLLLGGGTYFTSRVVKREIEIARLKADFVATVSHEFRSPLTGIRQLAEMLARGRVPTDRRRQDYYEHITRESDRLTRLVEHLLDFARMEEGRKEYRLAPVDASRWLRSVAAECQSEFAERNVRILTTIPEGLPPVMADAEALGCAIRNLVDNAVKYSPGQSAVWLEAEAAGSDVTIRVRDTGIGIAPGDRARIFDKFYRVPGDLSRQVKGAGLGLSLVDHIVKAHGATIACDSRVGEGTTFSIRLHGEAA